MAGWFYVESGGAVGPLSRIELEAAVNAGRVTPDTLVCEDGSTEWRLARRVPGLVTPKAMKAWQASVTASRRLAPPSPAPPPPPRVATSPEPAPAAPRRAYAAPSATPAEPVAAPAWRRHAGLVTLVAGAAAAGGVLGAIFVLKLAQGARPEAAAPALPAASVAGSPAAGSPAAAPPQEPAIPGRLRPDIPDAPPPLPAAAQGIVDERLAGVRAQLADYRAAADAFVSSGGADASTLPSREAIASRLTALEELRSRNEALRRALSELPDRVRAAAAEAGQAADVADAAARRAKADLAPDVREREADAEMQDVAGEVLGLLEQGFGSWSVKPGTRAVEFAASADPDAAQRYARLVEDAAVIAGR